MNYFNVWRAVVLGTILGTSQVAWGQCPAITISPSTLTPGQQGAGYGPVQVTVTGGTTPHAVSATGLPTGMSLNGAVQLTGTPSVSGTFAVRITARDARSCLGRRLLSLVIAAGSAPTITSANTAAVVVGQANTFTVTRTGVPTPTLSLSGDVLPSGVTFVAGTGVLSGNPVSGTGGTYNLVFTAANTILPNATQNFTLTVNERPSVSGGPFSLAENSADATVVGTVSVTDPHTPAQTHGWSITAGNTGSAFAINPSTGEITVATSAAVNFETTPSFSLTVQATDNGTPVLSGSATITVNLTNVNEAPTAVSDTITVAEGGTATVLSTPVGATSVLTNDSDPDVPTVLTVTTTPVSAPSNGSLTLNANGTFSYTHNGSETSSDSFVYEVCDDAPTPLCDTATVFITITAGNDAPVLTAGATLAYSENQAATAIDTTITVADADDVNLESATVQLTGNYQTGQDVLGFTDTATITGVFTPATGILALSGADTLVNYEAALRSVTYENTAQSPSTLPRTVTWIGNDGTTPSVGVTSTITVATVNDAPVVDLNGPVAGVDYAATFTEGTPAVIVDGTQLTVSDLDHANLASATVTITNVLNAGVETLTAIPTGSITVTYVAPTLTLSGSDTLLNYQQVLRTVTYNNTAPNPNPTARSITFVVNDGTDPSAVATSTVTVNAVNVAPSFTLGGNPATVNEDAGLQTVPAFATAISDGDGNTQTLTFNVTGNTNAALFSAGLSISATGVLTYTPAANANGTATITVTLSDNGSNTAPNVNTSAAQTFTITVTAVNDAPSFTDPDQTVPEDAGPQTVTPWATAITDGDPELTQNLTFAVTNNTNAGLFSSAPAISSPAGVLTYTPAANANGVATITVTLTDDGSNTAPNVNVVTQTFTITVTAVNDAPVNSPPTNPQTVNEDTALTFTGAGNVVSVSDVDAGAGTLDLRIRTTNGTSTIVTLSGTTVTAGTNGTADYTLSGTQTQLNNALGTLRFNPTLNFPGAAASGSASLQLTLDDNGNSPAPVLQDDDTFTVTVNQVNDPPVADNDSFDFIGNTELRVDLGAGTTPAALETTLSTFGVLDGDSDPVEGSAIVVSAITVGGCTDNSAPFSCTDGAVGTVNMDSTGRFSFVPAPGDIGGSETFTYILSDTGTPAPASAPPATVTLTRSERVWYVRNDAAAGGLGRSSDPFDTLAEAQIASLANDYIFVYFGNGTTTGQTAGFALKIGQRLIGEHAGLSLPVNLNGNGLPTNLVTAVPGNRPLLDDTTVGAPEGVAATDVIPVEIVGVNLAGNVNAIDWTTAAAFAGTGTLSIRDNVIRSAGVEGVDINLAGTGTLNLAFHNNTLTSAGNGLDINETGTGSVTITTFNDNVVTGNTSGVGMNIVNAIFDAVPGAGFNQVDGNTLAIGVSGNAVGGSGLALTSVQGNLFFDDLDVFASTSGVILSGTGSGLTFAVQPASAGGTSSIDADNGAAADINTVTLDLRLSTLTSDTGASGVNLNAINGQFSASAGSAVTKASGGGTAFVVTNSVSGSTVSYAGTVNVSAGAGVALTTNTGVTMNFSGGLTLSTGANAAFTATGGGTVNVTQNNTSIVNTIATTTGTALNVANTTIGASDITFRSINSNGGTNGIVLNATGSTGNLVVTGNSGVGTGGTIQNKAIGISLTSTTAPSFSWMQLNDFSDFAIRGASVVGFNLDNTVINGTNGTDVGADEASVRFTELTGSASVTSCNISGGVEDNFAVINTGGTLNRITFSGTTFGANSTAGGSDGILLEGQNAAVVNVTVQNGVFTSTRGDHFQLNLIGTASSDLVFTGNTITNNHPAVVGGGGGIRLTGGSAGGNVTATYNFSNNIMRDSNGTAIGVTKGAGAGTFTGTIDNNQIGVAGVANSGSAAGSGISVITAEGGIQTVTITNNQVRQYNNFGIEVRAGGLPTLGTANVRATVTGNTIANPGTQIFAKNGFQLNSGVTPGETFQVCLTFGGAGALRNSLVGSGTDGGTDFRLRQRQSTTVRLPGYAGANNDDAAVVTFAQGNNNLGGTPTGSATNTVPTGGGWIGGACPF